MAKDLIVFDMDGVLVEVTESYRATIQAVVKHFTGYEPTRPEIQDWKNRGGWNDDWLRSHAMIKAQGGIFGSVAGSKQFLGSLAPVGEARSAAA